MTKKTDELQIWPSLFSVSAEDKQYSNTVDLYDAVPKYFWGTLERENKIYLQSLQRSFKHRGVKYDVKIKPARVTDRDGTEKDFYPGKMEEIVEDALRKIATQGAGTMMKDKYGVYFTLYQVQQELKNHGYSYSIAQIKRSIMICAETKMVITSETDTEIGDYVHSLFGLVGLITQKDWRDKGKHSKCYVEFHPMVTASIKSGTFRQYDYQLCMEYDKNLARRLHKRLAHNFTQAEFTKPYEVGLITLLSENGLSTNKALGVLYKEQLEPALKEMIKKGVIHKFEIVRKTKDLDNPRKIKDYIIAIYPSMKFVSQQKRANKLRSSAQGRIVKFRKAVGE